MSNLNIFEINQADPNVSERCQRCLVTGASGFIGQRLCNFLKERGLFVRALMRTPKKVQEKKETNIQHDEVFYCDLNDLTKPSEQVKPAAQDVSIPQNAQFLESMHSIDTVFHLAGIAHASSNLKISKESYFKINVEATEQLMHMAHQAGVKRFIYFSSVKAINPLEIDFYGQSKKAAEHIVLSLGKKFNMHVTVLRPALVYGQNMKGNLGLMLRGIQQGWFPRLPETNNKRSLISLDDLLDITLQVAENPNASSKIYTITDGQSYSSKQLYESMRQALGKSPCRWSIPYSFFKIAAVVGDALQSFLKRTLPFNSEMLDKLLGSAYYSNDEIINDLKWNPKYNFFDVMRKNI